MNRLFQWLYAKAFGLRTVTIDQHIADLQRALNELTAERQAIDADIDQTMERLLSAIEKRDEISKQRMQAIQLKPVTRPASRSASDQQPEPRMTQHLCIYHHNCADGFAAAWAVRKYFAEHAVGELQFHPGIYGKPAPDVTGMDVFIVDFSYKRDELLSMASQANFILIIDHHKTAQKELVDLPDNVVTCFDMSKSGAVLAWDYLFTRPAPLLFDYIQDRDLWKFDLLGTHEITAALYAHEFNFEVWDRLIEQGAKPLLDEGLAILRKHRKDITAIVNSATRWMWFGQTKVPVANVPWMYASDVGAILAEGHPFAATYYDDAIGRKWSLRSTKDGADVSEIAESFGGGGHKHAAGFRMTPEETIDFELASGVMA